MIYLKNNTGPQSINIPYSVDPDAPVRKKVQKVKEFTVNQYGQSVIMPDSGYTSMEKVNLTAPVTGATVIFEPQGFFDYRNTYYASGAPWSALTVDADTFGNQMYNSGYGYAQRNIEVEAVELSVSANGIYNATIGQQGEGYIKKVIVDVPTGSTIHNQNKSITANTNGHQVITFDSGYTGLGTVDLNINVPTSGTSEPYFGKVAYFDERNVYGERFNNAFKSNISDFNSVGDYIKIGFSINCEDAGWFFETYNGSIGTVNITNSYNPSLSAGTFYIRNNSHHQSESETLDYKVNDQMLYILEITGKTGTTKDIKCSLSNITQGTSVSKSGTTDNNSTYIDLAIGSDREDFDAYYAYWSLYSYEVKTSQIHSLILPRSDMKFWDVINNTEVDVTNAYSILTEYIIYDEGHIGEELYFIPKYPWDIQ